MLLRRAGVIAGVKVSGAQRTEAGWLLRVALAGFVSAAVIPYLLLLALLAALLVPGLRRMWMGTADTGTLQGRALAEAFFLTHSLMIVLKRFWSFRWIGIGMGSVGALGALVGYYAARAGRSAKGATFLTILAPSTFATNAAALLCQEKRLALATAERWFFICHRLAASHWAFLILSTIVAFLLATLVWEAWRIIYAQLASWWGLPWPIASTPHRSSSQRVREDQRTPQDRIGPLKREATEPQSSLSELPRTPAIQSLWQRQWWAFALAIVVGLFVAMPLQGAFLRVAPAVTSDLLSLQPDQPTKLVYLTMGSEPQSITFCNSTGQGIVDFRLEDSEGRVLRKLKGFQLMDLPGIGYNTATMPIADLSPGTYVLRLALRPMEEGAAEEGVPDKLGGLISWSLLQGGGSWFRVLAILMAGLRTLIVINACILLAWGCSRFRDRSI